MKQSRSPRERARGRASPRAWLPSWPTFPPFGARVPPPKRAALLRVSFARALPRASSNQPEKRTRILPLRPRLVVSRFAPAPTRSRTHRHRSHRCRPRPSARRRVSTSYASFASVRCLYRTCCATATRPRRSRRRRPRDPTRFVAPPPRARPPRPPPRPRRDPSRTHRRRDRRRRASPRRSPTPSSPFGARLRRPSSRASAPTARRSTRSSRSTPCARDRDAFARASSSLADRRRARASASASRAARGCYACVTRTLTSHDSSVNNRRMDT